MSTYRWCTIERFRSSSKRPACTHKSARGCRWGFVIDLPARDGGRRHQHREQTFKTEQEAKEAKGVLLERLRHGETLDRRRTVADELRESLAGKRGLKASTRAGYEAHLRNFLIPALGDLPLDKLRPAHIDAMVRASRQAS